MARRYWLMKSEPESFSVDDLARAPRQTAFWDGVRNYQARNFLRARPRRCRSWMDNSSGSDFISQ